MPLSRLSKRVVDDGKFFDNLPTMRRGPSTDTLEKFAAFLADAANWPEGLVPDEVREFAHVTGVCPMGAVPSAGIGGTSSPTAEANAA